MSEYSRRVKQERSSLWERLLNVTRRVLWRDRSLELHEMIDLAHKIGHIAIRKRQQLMQRLAVMPDAEKAAVIAILSSSFLDMCATNRRALLALTRTIKCDTLKSSAIMRIGHHLNNMTDDEIEKWLAGVASIVNEDDRAAVLGMWTRYRSRARVR